MCTVSPSRNAGQRERRRLRRAALLALAAVSSTALTPVARAFEFPADIPLSSLNGANGFQLSGESRIDRSGAAVASAGDVNGDGFDDVIVGADGADSHGQYNSGASYVVFGKASGFAANLNLSALDGANGFQLSGEAVFDRSGDAVASAGDVNGDGFDEVIVGAYEADPPGRYNGGASYVVFGKASGFAANLIPPSPIQTARLAALPMSCSAAPPIRQGDGLARRRINISAAGGSATG